MVHRLFVKVRSLFAAKGNDLVVLGDDFPKAKRNLLWVSAALFLFGWSNPNVDGEYEIKVISDFTLSQHLLASVLIVFLLYNWWNFFRELRRVQHPVSQGAQLLGPVSANQRSEAVMRQFETTVEAIGSDLELWKNKLQQIGGEMGASESAESQLREEIALLQNQLEPLEEQSQTVWQDFLALFETTNQSDLTQNVALQYSKRAKLLAKKISESLASARALEDLVPNSDFSAQISAFEDGKCAADKQMKKLDQVQQELKVRSDEFAQFANSMDRQDIRDHFWLDEIIPHLCAFAAILSCIWWKFIQSGI